MILPSHSRFRPSPKASKTFLGRMLGDGGGRHGLISALLGRSVDRDVVFSNVKDDEENEGGEKRGVAPMGAEEAEEEVEEEEDQEEEEEEGEEEAQRRVEVEGDMVGTSVDEENESSGEENEEGRKKKEMEEIETQKWDDEESQKRYFFFPGIVYPKEGAWDATIKRYTPKVRALRDKGALAPQVRRKLRRKIPLSSLGSGMIGPGAPKRGVLPMNRGFKSRSGKS